MSPTPEDPLDQRGTMLVPVAAPTGRALQAWSEHLCVGLSELVTEATERYLHLLADTQEPPPPA